ncbi:cardiolipin synthetase, putative [Trypanosoma brucei gambiense DAL972]|uniref:Cardiolipin synthetase, putative n=1 Tax=Trypanosoma brucei gambiense (strain MHOM/CI/86/DAL972) TaxID=679716 RepID=C9ZMP8_TRYB9|nr:cardiolipin synthetase, putative [Trypanosoma brucei gambiense DAL972]CBH10551.1 cardiolipin synthetase, putative [Trypanosoma brucei gambiense DAL972]|eukprot:XP_011772840.1 cardiolipin synthetase, putative [Trypanosoma brucei gambiense DAL972]
MTFNGRFRATLRGINIRNASMTSLSLTGSHAQKQTVLGSTPGALDTIPTVALNGVNPLPRYRHNLLFGTLSFGDRWDRIQRRLAVLGRASTGNVVVPFSDSADAFRRMWESVDSASDSVLWQTYICKDDFVGRKTVKKLEEAHRRGCKTELLYDCGGNITGRRRLVGDLKKSGANVIEHRPMWEHFFPYFLRGMKWELSPGIRNHRKILIVDNKLGFCGGLNIGDEYCGTSEGGNGRFRDTHCVVMGPAVMHMREVYEDTKAPKPWKWSLARWRQIASATMNLRYLEGMNVKHDYLEPTTTFVRQGGGVYLRRQMERAERSTVRMMERMRWKRQRERLNRCLLTLAKNLREGQGLVFKASTGKGDDVATTDAGSKRNDEVSHGQWKLMKRRIDEYRQRAIKNAEESFFRRLRVVNPSMRLLEDTSPVAEAEAYGQAHAAVTQVLSCNPHSRDWSIPYAFWQVSKFVHQRLWVTTPYYMPHRKLMRALQLAARRGVDVRILAGSNRTTDPWFMWYASNYITGMLMASGVRVYEYKGGQVMHAKTVVADSIWTSIGSYNWDMMSNKNMEICVCHLDHNLALTMEKQFLDDMNVSEEVNYEEYQRRSLWLRFSSWFFYTALRIAEKFTFRTFWDPDLSSEID